MSASLLEYLRVCGSLLLVVFLVALSAQTSNKAARMVEVQPPPNAHAMLPPGTRILDVIIFVRNDPRIERVARAICRLQGIDPDHEGPPFPEGPVWELKIPEAMKFLAELDAAEAKEK